MQKTIYDEAAEQGELRGELRAGRRLLLIQLEAKFGPLPDRSRRKIERLTFDEIEGLVRRVITATNRRELGL
ncbi:MAG: hypothetical protein ACKV2Q_16030 [Planctomycetaceae bacterium]